MSAPRWLDILQEALSEEKSPTYTLSTVLSTPSGVYPRSRSVIHRGILTPHSSPSRPLLLTTTDIRMPKAHQLHHNPNTEATFWFPKSNTQIRIVASAHLISHPSHPWRASFPADDALSSEVDWDSERVKAFESVSGHLRATFVRPMPGSPLSSYDEGKHWATTVPKPSEAKGEEQESLVNQALDHFVLVVLDPTEIDFVELEPIPHRRTTWTKKSNNEWAEQIVVP